MKREKLTVLLYVSLNLALASLVWATILIALPMLYYAEVPGSQELRYILTAALISFVLAWAPALLTYAKIDLVVAPPTGLKRLSYFALSGMITAMALPLLGIILTLLVNIVDPGYALLGDIPRMFLLALWIGVPGLFAGALFGALMKQIAPPRHSEKS